MSEIIRLGDIEIEVTRAAAFTVLPLKSHTSVRIQNATRSSSATSVTITAGGGRLFRTRPFEPAQITFAECIQEVSPKFCEIYDQAHKAEGFSLLQVCGVGYRKALEFLIKDYLIKKHPEDEAAIKAKPLGRCIDDDVEDPKTKAVAKRATWLGNDETHYQRLWIDKDLSDLKTLITLVLYWIEAEHLTEEALTSMPAKT
jgi:hypothetical protein